MQKKSIKIQIVTDSSFIDQNRRVMSFFKAKNMSFNMKNKKTHSIKSKQSVFYNLKTELEG